MAEKITEAECESEGLELEREEDLHRAQHRLIKMTINRGPGCDGGVRVETIIKTLPLEVQTRSRILLKNGRDGEDE